MTAITELDNRPPIILVVDDDPSGMGVIVTHLKEHGFQVIISRDGESGLKRAEYARPDLILLDVTMPGIDGFETCRRLKANKRTKNIPVIFLTALSDTVDKLKGFEAGGADYITKPFHVEEALSRIDTHLSLRKAQQRLRGANERLRREIVVRKRADEELRKSKETAESANRAKSVFLSNMSHELRSPLNAILGFTQVLNRSRKMPSEEKKNLAIIRRSGEHLLALINDVLDMSKIEAGRTVLNEQNFDLYRLLDDLEDMFSLHAKEKGLRLMFECDANVPHYVRTDAVKLRQVLVNLLGNALKFTEKGGVTVRVGAPLVGACQERNASLCLEFDIADTGSGIAGEELEIVFDAFVQSDSGLQSQEGTGLGLPISRKFVQMMGGDMTVESQVGKGSVFRFWIQAEATDSPEVEPAQPEKRVIALEENQPCHRILIADDREANRLLLRKILALPGLEVCEAANGQEALNIWKTWEPCLIFMDMRMPVMDGFEAAKKIKGMPQGIIPVIIAVTAGAVEKERAVVLSAGCDDFVCKPYTESRIFDVIHRHLGVRFVYETPPLTETTDTPDPKREAINIDALAELPAELIGNMEQAIMNIDLDMTSDLIKQISARDTLLADRLRKYVDNFEYERILTLIQKTVSQNRM